MPAPKRVWTEQERALVARMAMIGIPQETIALVLKTTKETLEKYFRQELDESAAKANTAIAGKLYQMAMGGNVAALIFWCKTRLGWRETVGHEVTGKDGGPLIAVIEER